MKLALKKLLVIGIVLILVIGVVVGISVSLSVKHKTEKQNSTNKTTTTTTNNQVKTTLIPPQHDNNTIPVGLNNNNTTDECNKITTTVKSLPFKNIVLNSLTNILGQPQIIFNAANLEIKAKVLALIVDRYDFTKSKYIIEFLNQSSTMEELEKLKFPNGINMIAPIPGVPYITNGLSDKYPSSVGSSRTNGIETKNFFGYMALKPLSKIYSSNLPWEPYIDYCLADENTFSIPVPDILLPIKIEYNKDILEALNNDLSKK